MKKIYINRCFKGSITAAKNKMRTFALEIYRAGWKFSSIGKYSLFSWFCSLLVDWLRMEWKFSPLFKSLMKDTQSIENFMLWKERYCASVHCFAFLFLSNLSTCKMGRILCQIDIFMDYGVGILELHNVLKYDKIVDNKRTSMCLRDTLISVLNNLINPRL